MSFLKGQSGNPYGRRIKGHTLVDLIEKYAKKKNPDADGNEKYRESIARKLVEGAASGDIRFMTEYFDRTEGRARQSIEHGGGLDLHFTIDWGTNAAGDEPEIPVVNGEPETI